MSRYASQPTGFSFEPPAPNVRNVLIALGGLYVLELLVGFTAGRDLLYLAAWSQLYNPWQPFTRVLVQLSSPIWVAVELFILYQFIPFFLGRFSQRQLIEMAIATFVGSTVFVYALALVGVATGGVAAGWSIFLIAMFAVFGLSLPNAQVNLFFVLPIKAEWITWGSGILALLTLLFSAGFDSSAYIGAWAGGVGWWFLRGPGARRRSLKQKGRRIEKELRGFRVHDGGRSGARGRDNDDWVN